MMFRHGLELIGRSIEINGCLGQGAGWEADCQNQKIYKAWRVWRPLDDGQAWTGAAWSDSGEGRLAL